VVTGLLDLCGGVAIPASAVKVRSNSLEISNVDSLPSLALGYEESGDVDATVSISPEPTDMLFILVLGLLSYDCWLRCLELSSLERFTIFSPSWLLPNLDPKLIDGFPQCLIRVALWSHALARVSVLLLFGPSLGLVVGVHG
jgi:hypothetical protein